MTIETAIYLQSIALIILAVAVAFLNISVRYLIRLFHDAIAGMPDDPEPPDYDEKSIS
jgi:hypothetical protein